MQKRITLLVSVLALSIALLACQASGLIPTVQPTPIITATAAPALPQAISMDSGLQVQEAVLTALYEQAMPGVVAIRTADGLGSGFVYSADGYIVTNNHVVEGADTVEVDFASGHKTYGQVVGRDPHSDIAVVKVDAPAEELHPLPLGDSSQVKVGQLVIAIGNPFGLDGTMTTGIISALGRTLPSGQATAGGTYSIADIIQTDTALNPGNSGGPLFDLNGEVIGMNSAIRATGYTSTGEAVNSGIGFAISVNLIKRIVPVLIEKGTYIYPYLGIASHDDLTLDVIQELGLKNTTGAYVTNVVSGGPADLAGLRAGSQPTSITNLYAGGDLIIAIDGHSVHVFNDLLSYLYENKLPGDTVLLTVMRGERTLDLTVTLGARP